MKLLLLRFSNIAYALKSLFLLILFLSFPSSFSKRNFSLTISTLHDVLYITLHALNAYPFPSLIISYISI